MRHKVWLRVFAVCFILASSAVASTSQRSPAMYVRLQSQGGGNGIAVGVERTEFYLDDPSASMVAQTASGASLNFALRAWKEGEKARVVVFARLDDTRAPRRTTETPIATFTIRLGETVNVTEAQAWGVSPLTATAVAQMR